MRFRPMTAAICVLTLVQAAPARAQDRLFLHQFGGTAVEIGAIGRFGEVIGPAPADAFTHPFPSASPFRLTDDGIVEAASGAVVFRSDDDHRILSWTATPDASRLFVSTFSATGFAPLVLRAIDVGSRSEVAHYVSPFNGSTVTWLPGDRILLSGPGSPAVAFDRHLLVLAVVPMASYCAPTWLVSAHSGRAYLLTASGYSGNFLSGSLTAFDTLTGRKVGEVNLGPVSSCYTIGATLWTAPGPPQRLDAAVRGRDVALSWLPRDLAEGYVLDVGLAPGRTDVAFFVGTSTHVVFANVPPGRYYVRVRAGNVVGGGRPSAEIQVVVP